MTEYGYQQVFTNAAKFEVHRLAAARIRIRYLKEAIEVYSSYNDPLIDLWAWEAFEEIIWLLDKSSVVISKYSNSVTPDDIERAKEYPIGQLVPSAQNFRTKAWCHDDKNPSLHVNIKKNKCFCNVCCKAFNPIDVLISRDSMKFYDAVRWLLNN